MLDAPLPQLLQTGGDHRLIVDSNTGLTPYRVSSRTSDAIPLGSCTASSPSPYAYQAAEKLLARLRESSTLEDTIEDVARGHVQQLKSLFELPEGTAVVLTPSGTDVIYLLSIIALGRASRARHLVVGASELGGGTMAAAQGHAISDCAPFATTTVGTPLEGIAERCSAEPIYLRDKDGVQVDEEEIDGAVRDALERLHDDTAAVLHLVAHSKTGLRAPSASLCEELSQRWGQRLIVLVDGAQGRLAPRDIRRALASGFAVLFTGSKFYSGPPFCSALLLPEGLASDPGPLPASLSDWFSRDGLPASWEQARSSLRERTNPGLSLRWEAAMAEIQRYHAIPPRYRASVYHTFAGAVHEVFGPSKTLELDVPMPPVHRLLTALGAFPSVFCFRVRGADGFLDKAALSSLHRLLDTDLGDAHPFLSQRFHLGQPVALGPPGTSQNSVLRVALGARLVSDLDTAPDGGGTWFRGVFRALRQKAEYIVSQELL